MAVIGLLLVLMRTQTKEKVYVEGTGMSIIYSSKCTKQPERERK